MSIRIPFFNRQPVVKEDAVPEQSADNIPRHVAIIMDGNGRWALNKGLPRIAGHKEGMNVVQKIVRAAVHYNIEILTLFAFSTENWKRPKPEVDYILRLPKEFIHLFLPELMEYNVRIETIGDFDSLPAHTKEAVMYMKNKTKHNTGLLLNFALNYGGRYEIVEGLKRVISDVEAGRISKEQLSEEIFSSYLYTHNLCDPDLVIRTSGEQRISNFLLWQSAYSEFWFTDVLWPDFNEELFKEAIEEYQSRIRRYGGI